MGAKKRSIPGSISVGGEVYALGLLRIHGRDKHGRPKDCEFLYDEETVNLKGGEEFMTVFVPKHMQNKRN